MTEKPILMSGEMVRAILAGRKTQTRRILKDPVLTKPPYFFSGEVRHSLGCPRTERYFWAGFRDKPNWRDVPHPDLIGSASYVRCPYGKAGEGLWVRETWKPIFTDGSGTGYRADSVPGSPEDKGPWKPSIFMTRARSRITLEVTDVRVERLQDISEEDAIAEGVAAKYSPAYYNVLGQDGMSMAVGENYMHGIPKAGDDWQGMRVAFVQHVPLKQVTTAREEYCSLWFSINGPGSWAANPWVWVLSFRVLSP